ncbi:pentapeptide repeat-containing protein [Nostoc sp.]|uniref:pentapeptide repeat-containing protein n=1 Tax=Nostoc sp. TaxID=1180 RepID=UPI002FF4C2A8
MDEFEEILRLNALQEEIMRRYLAGERNFAGADLRNIWFSYPCLMDINFSAANLEGASFGGTYLVNANFSGTNLERSRLCTCFINSDLSHTNLRGAEFIGAELTGADLTGATLRSTKLIGCNLRDADLTDIKVDERTVFVSTVMPDGTTRTDSIKQIIDTQKLRQRFYGEWQDSFQGIIMHDADLAGIDLHSTWMHPLNISGAYFSNVNFRDANLSRVDFNRSSFIGCDFRGANFGANLEGAELIDIDFRGSDLSHAAYPAHQEHPIEQYAVPLPRGLFT